MLSCEGAAPADGARGPTGLSAQRPCTGTAQRTARGTRSVREGYSRPGPPRPSRCGGAEATGGSEVPRQAPAGEPRAPRALCGSWRHPRAAHAGGSRGRCRTVARAHPKTPGRFSGAPGAPRDLLAQVSCPSGRPSTCPARAFGVQLPCRTPPVGSTAEHPARNCSHLVRVSPGWSPWDIPACARSDPVASSGTPRAE